MKEKLASLLLRLLAATWRFDRRELPTIPDRLVLSFWHDEMLCFWAAFAHSSATGVTSLSKDGDLLAQLLNDWGYTVLRGSSSKGSKDVLAAMTEAAARSRVLLTPDGPRGPAHVYKAGAAVAAMRAEVELMHCRADISSSFVFKKSWDQFKLPKPFARIGLRCVARHIIAPDTPREDVDEILGGLSEALSHTSGTL